MAAKWLLAFADERQSRPTESRHDEESRGASVLPGGRVAGATVGAAQGGGSDPTAKEHDRPTRLLSRRADEERRRRSLGQATQSRPAASTTPGAAPGLRPATQAASRRTFGARPPGIWFGARIPERVAM